MNRRRFLTLVLNALPFAATVRAGARPTPAPVRLQESPVAGFQFHRGGAAWPRLRVCPDPWERVRFEVRLPT